MSEFKLKGGATMTEADFEKLSKEAEKGNYPGTPGEWLVRPQGRPRISDEELVSVTIKVTASQRDAMDARAAELGETRSQFVREAVEVACGIRACDRRFRNARGTAPAPFHTAFDG